MRTVPTAVALALAAVAGCGGPVIESQPLRDRQLTPAEIRRPAVFIQVSVAPGTAEDRDQAGLAEQYAGALLEGLETRAILARDVTVARSRQDAVDLRQAVRRAREVDADHAVLIDVRLDRRVVRFCTDTRRPLEAPVMVMSQRLEVARAADGVTRLRADDAGALGVTDVEVNCERPNASHRRTGAEMVAAAVDRLLRRLLGP